MKKLIVVLCLLLCLSLCGCQTKKEQKDDIYIFFTSDVHCGVDSNVAFASLKALVDDTKAEHPYVSLVDCGDYLQGGTLGSMSDGALVVTLMNDVGYDVVTLGNHEFDYGASVLAERINEMDFKVVASNASYTGTEVNALEKTEEYVILDYDGTKVAFIGIMTPSTITSSTPAYFMENDEFVYDFYGGENGAKLFAQIQKVVDEVKKQKVDYVVALSHLGSDVRSTPYDVVSLIAATEGIDAILDGHSHSLITEDRYPNKNGDDVVVSSVGTKLQEVGELILGKDHSISAVHVTEYERQDEEILKDIEEAYGYLDEILSQVICDTDHDLKITDDEGIRITRSRESVCGDFVADAYRYEMGTDIALCNGGGVRADILTGTVTYQSLLNVNPFQNVLASCYASGQQILDALEFGARNVSYIYQLDGSTVGEFGGFFQVSGLKFTIDTSVESAVVIDDNKMFSGFSSDVRRVKDVYVEENGEYVPIDPEKTYSVGCSNYVLFNGGDGNTVFQDCERIVEEGPMDVQALIDYCWYLGGLSGLYTEAEGRITIE